jgi:hypothetical protein
MVTDKTTIIDTALEYARRGWSVFPVKARDKIPATKNGFKAASTDEVEVRNLFAGRGECNVGLATGPESGLWVLDLDGEEGIKAIEKLEEENGPLPESIVACTGGGGRHHFFALNGEPIKNRAKLGNEPIDVRGDGGYVVVPPSIHKSGSPYEWEIPLDAQELEEAPTWLVDLVTADNSDTSVGSKTEELVFEVGSSDSLKDHPGAGEGSRHGTLLSLVGKDLARGKSSGEVERGALLWASRCNPPLDEKEARKIVEDLSRKQTNKVAKDQTDFESVPLPAPRAWPTPRPEVFHGLAGRFVEIVSPETEADSSALVIQFLAYFGSVVGRGPRIRVGATDHFTSLYCVIVGETSRARKGTGGDWIRFIFSEVDPHWSDERVLDGGLSSGEGVIHALRDEDEPSDKRLLVSESEFVAVLRVCRREGNILAAILRNGWDGKDLRTLTKNDPLIATRPHLSLVCHITEAELRKFVLSSELHGGTINRFLWGLSRRSKLLPEGGRIPDLSSIITGLKDSVSFARSVGLVERDEPARSEWRSLYLDLAGRQYTGALAGACSRAEAQCLRLSLLYALLDQSSTIKVVHVRAARALWDYCEESARLIFGDSSGDPIKDRALAIIRSRPGVSRWDLHRELGKHHKAEVLVRVLAEIRDDGLIRNEKQETGGRSAEVWFPATGPEAVSEIREESPGADTSLNSLNSQQEEVRI